MTVAILILELLTLVALALLPRVITRIVQKERAPIMSALSDLQASVATLQSNVTAAATAIQSLSASSDVPALQALTGQINQANTALAAAVASVPVQPAPAPAPATPPAST